MLTDMISLIEKFNEIKNRGWIESMRKGTSGIGRTFENLLGIQENSLPLPDYGCFEIKTRYRNSKFPMALFNVTPDGDYAFPMKRLYKRFAYPQHGDIHYRIFCADMYANCETYAGRNYRFKLIVDRKKEEIRVVANSKKTGIIDTGVTWSFKLLKEKLNLKLKYLALVKADVHNRIDKQYYRYYEINFYILRGFEEFISLIEDGSIKVVFDLGCYKTGPKAGLMNSHGSSFEIGEKDLERLFVKIG